ncbi:MAG: hypothetical protein J7518_21030 [Nocardioidaceae bacterium]|nr:hypothetical protein [Nocardioidaceae bacterium]
MKLFAILVVSLALPFAVVAPARASSDPVAFTAPVPAGVALSGVSVNLEPSAATVKRLGNGESAALRRLPASALSLSGSSLSGGTLRVRLAPSVVPPAYVDPGGVVTFEVVALGSGGTATWATTTSARAVRTGAGVRWVDAEAAVRVERGARGIPAYDGRTRPARAGEMALLSRRAGSERGAAGNCVGVNPRKKQVDEKLVWTTIGTTYAVGQSSAWMYVDSSKGATYGLAASGSGKYGTWQLSGTRKISGGWGFEWDPARGSRSYQKQIEYRKYRYQFLDSRCDHYAWEPLVETGGVGAKTDIARPDFKNCVPVLPGKWWRDRSDGFAYSYGGAVKLHALLGIDLSIERQYSSSQLLKYKIVGHQLMCGKERHPSYSSKVMEKKRG